MGEAKRSSGRAGGWAMKAEDRFIETLAESANVTLSAAAAGVSPSAAYRRRGRDASFRARWGEALATGYAQLEMALGARRGAGGGNPGGRGPGDRPRLAIRSTVRSSMPKHASRFDLSSPR